MAKTSDEVEAARALVAQERHGVLSTAHAELHGWPFGSLVPYALTAASDPVLLLSDIAEHTHNLAKDPRASLLVADPAAASRPQAGARVTVLGRCAVPKGAEGEAALSAYFGRFPESKAHLSAHGFSPYVLEVERVRWIAGFGSMGWLSRGEWSPPPAAPDPLARHAAGILEHMNRDHADALVDLARHHASVRCVSARMTEIDARGCEIEISPGGRGKPSQVRIAFPAPALTPDAARKALIALLADARRAIPR